MRKQSDFFRKLTAFFVNKLVKTQMKTKKSFKKAGSMQSMEMEMSPDKNLKRKR